ncbi:MAG: glycosyltransferase family 2 protein [Armatimonadota bacterium]|nr:glycosyltransferase family 2 protein [bacterium]
MSIPYTSPKITIGIPFYNCEETLADTVRSVFAQSFQDWELILLDDGSTDNSLAIAKSINDERVRVISDGINKGIGARRHQIVELASADFLAWQDADDLMHPERLTIQYDYLQKYSNIGLVDAWSYLIDTANNIVGISRLKPLDLHYEDLIRGPVLTNGTSLGRIELYRNNQFDPSFNLVEDWDVWVRAFKSYQFGRIPQPLYFRRYVSSDGRLFELKQWRHLPYARRIMLTYGPKMIGWKRTLSALADYHIRLIARTLLSIAGLERLRPGSHGRMISEDEKIVATTAVNQIINTTVLGF